VSRMRHGASRRRRSSRTGWLSEAHRVGVMSDTKENVMKRSRILVAFLCAGAMLGGSAGAVLGAEQHPPKFNVHSTQCTGANNQPNCPGNH
jgi:hypothetical protein